MRLTSTWPFIALGLGAGCAAIQVHDQLANARGKPLALVERASFDGTSVKGRLLISAVDGGIVVDRRLHLHSIFRIDDVRDCDGGETINYTQLDGVAFRPQPDELLTIEPGYWFGRDFSLYVYDDKAPPPTCLQATVGLSLEAAAPGAEYLQFVVRAYLDRPDAGTGIDADASAPDAGTP